MLRKRWLPQSQVSRLATLEPQPSPSDSKTQSLWTSKAEVQSHRDDCFKLHGSFRGRLCSLPVLQVAVANLLVSAAVSYKTQTHVLLHSRCAIALRKMGPSPGCTTDSRNSAAGEFLNTSHSHAALVYLGRRNDRSTSSTVLRTLSSQTKSTEQTSTQAVPSACSHTARQLQLFSPAMITSQHPTC